MGEGKIYRLIGTGGTWFQFWLYTKGYKFVIYFSIIPFLFVIAFFAILSGRLIVNRGLVIFISIHSLSMLLLSLYAAWRGVEKVRTYEIQLFEDRIVQRMKDTPEKIIVRDEVTMLTLTKHYGLRIRSAESRKQIVILPKTENYDEVVKKILEWQPKDKLAPMSLYRVPYPVIMLGHAVLFVLIMMGRSIWLVGLSLLMVIVYNVYIVYDLKYSSLRPKKLNITNFILTTGLTLLGLLRFILLLLR